MIQVISDKRLFSSKPILRVFMRVCVCACVCVYLFHKGWQQHTVSPHLLADTFVESQGHAHACSLVAQKASRYFQSRIRCHIPTKPLHVTSLIDSFLFYYCVPHDWSRDTLFQFNAENFTIFSTLSLCFCGLCHCV